MLHSPADPPDDPDCTHSSIVYRFSLEQEVEKINANSLLKLSRGMLKKKKNLRNFHKIQNDGFSKPTV
jgi:hypothetical protein